MDIEQRLRTSLEVREPGAGFEDAVLARVRAQSHAAGPLHRRIAWRIPAALAAAVLAAAVGLHWHSEQRRAIRDRDQLVLALAITSHKLEQVRQRLDRTSELNSKENGT